MPQTDLLKRLRDIRDEERDLEKQLQALRNQRDPLIREAVRRGYSERKVASAVGLSQPRVHAICVQKR